MAPAIFLLGLFLCFLGGKIVRPALYITGLSIGLLGGWWVGKHFDNPNMVYALAGIGAIAVAVLVMMVFSAGMVLLGAAAGGVLYHGFELTAGQHLDLPVWGIFAAAGAGALLSMIFRKKILALLTAIVGGYLIVEAGSRLLGGHVDWTEAPQFPPPPLKDAAWFVLSAAGMILQRRKRSGKREE